MTDSIFGSGVCPARHSSRFQNRDGSVTEYVRGHESCADLGNGLFVCRHCRGVFVEDGSFGYATRPTTFAKDPGGDMEPTPYPIEDGVYRCKTHQVESFPWGIATVRGGQVEWRHEGSDQVLSSGPAQCFPVWGEKIG